MRKFVGAQRFVAEVIGRVRRAGATGRLVLRMDAGFWSNKTMDLCDANDVWFSISVRMHKAIATAIATIEDDAWVDIADYIGARAQVAETTYKGRRLIVRRTLNQGLQPTLIEDWRHHAFLTNRPGSFVFLDRDHRAHATVELDIRDLKHGAGMVHMPSGHFQANAAWAVACTLAHNTLRWMQLLGDPDVPLVTAKTFRRRVLNVPGRIVTSGRTRTLRLPTGWPWEHLMERILIRLRALPQRLHGPHLRPSSPRRQHPPHRGPITPRSDPKRWIEAQRASSCAQTEHLAQLEQLGVGARPDGQRHAHPSPGGAP